MSCPSVTEDLRIHVGIQVGGGYKVLFKFSAEGFVQTTENGCRIMCVNGLACESHLEHGGNQRCRNAVSRDVGHEDAELIGFGYEKIVEISRDCAHRQITGRDIKPGKSRHLTRKDGSLNLLGDLQLFLDG